MDFLYVQGIRHGVGVWKANWVSLLAGLAKAIWAYGISDFRVLGRRVEFRYKGLGYVGTGTMICATCFGGLVCVAL